MIVSYTVFPTSVYLEFFSKMQKWSNQHIYPPNPTKNIPDLGVLFWLAIPISAGDISFIYKSLFPGYLTYMAAVRIKSEHICKKSLTQGLNT